MLKKFLYYVDNSLLGEGFFYLPAILLDRLLFYSFFRFYYKLRFKNYGKNIRWGRNFRKYIIPNNIRISCPEKISILDNCSFDENIYLQCDQKSNGLSIGKNCRINAYCHILAGDYIHIEEKVLIAPFCLISSNNHCSTKDLPIMEQGMNFSGQVFISSGSWLGQNSKILGGVHLGKNSVIAAGSVVLKGNYPHQSTLVGIPARNIKHE